MRDYSKFQVWAPNATTVDLVLTREGHTQRHSMQLSDGGWWSTPDLTATRGDLYAFSLDNGDPLPDPRSLSQPEGVHGPSRVVDPTHFEWLANWAGTKVLEGAIYELHIGTFSGNRDNGTSGTFDTAIERLDHLVDLGVRAVEVMPVAAIPGDRGWGYDGVDLFATFEPYGGPEAFARFINAAHERGLGVILDVVYNHLGPAGNYLPEFGPYFNNEHLTPWGASVNYDGDGSREVRNFVLANVRQWLVDFHLDGLRLDAVHELRDDSPKNGGLHILAEIATAVAELERETGRPLTLIAESDQNNPQMVTPVAEGGRGMDAQWADDVHHALHSWISGETSGYYCDFGSAEAVKKTLERVFFHDGIYSTFREKDWGAPVDPQTDAYSARSFVAFIQDHDQVGNRAQGDRLHHTISFEQQAAVAALYLLAPTTPMLFMGEEWAATTPFPFFSNHSGKLGEMVSKGREEEFARMAWSGEVPDPQDRATFEMAFLDWAELEQKPHAQMLELYRTLLHLRASIPDFHHPHFSHVNVEILAENAVLMRRGEHGVIAVNGGEVRTGIAVEPSAVLASAGKVTREADGTITFTGPGMLVFGGAATPPRG